jgi:DnaK suppressor protein
MAGGPAPGTASVLRVARGDLDVDVDTKAVREQLLRRREELRQRASDASADLRHESDPLSADFAEQVTQRENDDVLGAISHSAQAELQQVEAALRRLASGRYTTCAVCGEDIEPERLAAVPYTDRCRSCAEGTRSSAGRGQRG